MSIRFISSRCAAIYIVPGQYLMRYQVRNERGARFIAGCANRTNSNLVKVRLFPNQKAEVLLCAKGSLLFSNFYEFIVYHSIIIVSGKLKRLVLVQLIVHKAP